MAIKLNEYVDEKTIKKASKRDGIYLHVLSDERKSSVRLFVKKVPTFYNRIIIDIDHTGYKISNKGRENLKKLTDFYGKPDVREPKRSFLNSYILDIEVQRGGDDLSGEVGILDRLFTLLEKQDNLEKMF
jgi:hypothetical protein